MAPKVAVSSDWNTPEIHNRERSWSEMTDTASDVHGAPTDDQHLLPELVAHLREHRAELSGEWARRIDTTHLLQAMTPQEISS